MRKTDYFLKLFIAVFLVLHTYRMVVKGQTLDARVYVNVDTCHFAEGLRRDGVAILFFDEVGWFL